MGTPKSEGLSAGVPAIAVERASSSTYRLVFSPGRGKSTQSVDTADASSALILAQRHGKGRKAELWRGDKLVARISENTFAGFWEIG